MRTDVHFYRQDTLIALRHKEWKLFIKDPNPWDDGPKQKDMPLLYNVEHDPSEKYDLAKSRFQYLRIGTSETCKIGILAGTFYSWKGR